MINKIILKLAMMLINLIDYPTCSIEDISISDTYMSLKYLYNFERDKNISSLVRLGHTINKNYSSDDAIKYITYNSGKYDKFKKIDIKGNKYVTMIDEALGYNKTIFQKIERLFFNISYGIMLKNYYKKYRRMHLEEFKTTNG